MSSEESENPNASLKAIISEKNNEVAQLRHEISGFKHKEKKFWEWIEELENNQKDLIKNTISKQVYDELANTLELVKRQNNELECKILELTKENESLSQKANDNFDVTKYEKVEMVSSNNDTIILQYENELEEAKNQILELEKSVEEIRREKNELCDLKDLATGKIDFLEGRIAELEDENFSLLKKISDADEYISKQEDDKKKSSEKFQMKEQGCNLFTEIIEGGKKIEDDLKLAYEKYREEKKISHSLGVKISVLQNEYNRLQEELIRFSTKKEIVYTEANVQKLVALEDHIKDLEKQLADQTKVINELISNDDNKDTFKYKVENQKLRSEINKKLERYNSKIRSLSEELDQSKICIEKLRNAVVELRSIAYKSDSYKDTSIDKKLHEIQVNFDIRLSTSPKENSVGAKRKLKSTHDIKEKVKNFRIDSNTQSKNVWT